MRGYGSLKSLQTLNFQSATGFTTALLLVAFWKSMEKPFRAILEMTKLTRGEFSSPWSIKRAFVPNVARGYWLLGDVLILECLSGCGFSKRNFSAGTFYPKDIARKLTMWQFPPHPHSPSQKGHLSLAL